MPYVKKMLAVQVFPHPFNNLDMSVGNKTFQFHLILFKPVDRPHQTFFLHMTRGFHFVTLEIVKIETYLSLSDSNIRNIPYFQTYASISRRAF